MFQSTFNTIVLGLLNHLCQYTMHQYAPGITLIVREKEKKKGKRFQLIISQVIEISIFKYELYYILYYNLYC